MVQRVLRSRALAVAFALVLTGFALAVPATTYACPSQESETDYFTDATKTVECGYKYVYCCGIERSGCVTPYFTTYSLGACF